MRPNSEAIMAIVLSPDVERQIEELVQTEQFPSAEEFIRQCVERYFREKKRCDALWIEDLARREDVRRQVEEGARELEEGNYTDYDDAGLKAFFEQIKSEGRKEMGLPAKNA
jgi:Arc/MetJ-type ribon-helix-helix transcriptional regulator